MIFLLGQTVNVYLEHSTVRGVPGLPPLVRPVPIVPGNENIAKMKQPAPGSRLSFESHIMSTARNRRKATSSSKRDSNSKNSAARRKPPLDLEPDNNPLMIIDRLVKETKKSVL